MKELKIAEALIGPTKTTKSLIEKCKGFTQKEDDIIDYEKVYKLGLEFELKGNYENALIQFEKANSITANKTECVGKIENCKTIIEKRKKEEKIAQLWITIRVENEAKNYDNTLKYLQQILVLDPSNIDAIELKTVTNLIKNAQAKEQKKDWEEAISIYKRILIYYPEKNELKNEIEKAIKNCQNQAGKTKLLNSNSDFTEFDKAYQKGMEFLKIEEYSQASNWFYTASRYNPDNNEVREKINFCLSKRIEFDNTDNTDISSLLNSSREVINAKVSPEIELKKDGKNNSSVKYRNKMFIGIGCILILIGLYYTMSPKKAAEVASTSDSTAVVLLDTTSVTNKQYPPTATDTIRSYTGKEYNNLPNGQGKATYKNGDTFEGEFKDGNRVKGKYTWIIDESYCLGDYEKNTLYNGTIFNAEGKGLIEYVNGEQKVSQVKSQQKKQFNIKKKSDTSNNNEEIYVDPWENNTQKTSTGNGMVAK